MPIDNESTSQQRGSYILVNFKGNRREVYANPYEFPFKSGDYAVLEADRGHDAGRIKHTFRSLNCSSGYNCNYKVIRKATLQDRERIQGLVDKEDNAIRICREKVVNHHLPMKVVDVEFRFDGLKSTFYFTADGRVDFRELVRDLAGTFRTRIELRQIGARDESKRTDGYGVCGKRLCCVEFLNNFKPITTQMAKDQNLILNPSKLSGRCGRLKCCLAYEQYDASAPLVSSNMSDMSGDRADETEIEQMSD